jgi:hypothetical protein
VKRVAVELIWIALVTIAIFYGHNVWSLYSRKTTPETYVPRPAQLQNVSDFPDQPQRHGDVAE